MKNTLLLKGVNTSIKTLLAFLFLVNVAAGLYMPLMAVFAIEHIAGATLALVGSAGATYSVMKSVIQMPIAKWIDKQRGEKWDYIILLAAGISGVLYTFYLLFVDTITEFYIFEVFSGIIDGFMMAAFYAIFSHHIDKESQGFEWSLFSILGITIAVAVGSFFGGRVADVYGFKPLFMIAGTLNVIGALILVFLNKQMRVMRKAEHYKQISDEAEEDIQSAS